MIGTHFTRTGFVQIENQQYYEKWNERARRARKRFFSYVTGKNTENIHIEQVDQEAFVQAFKQVRVKHLYKSDYIRYLTVVNLIVEAFKLDHDNNLITQQGINKPWHILITFMSSNQSNLAYDLFVK